MTALLIVVFVFFYYDIDKLKREISRLEKDLKMHQMRIDDLEDDMITHIIKEK